jgi:hypothetical protein
MAVRIIHKKSETTGSAPTITDLTTGEFGVNAADGDVFIRILMDPAGANIAGNQQILSVRRPLYADGGVITAPSLGILRLLTETGDNLITAANDYINTDGAAPTTAAFRLRTEVDDNLTTAAGDYINTDYNNG